MQTSTHRIRQVLAKKDIFQITIPITTAGSGGSVQQCLSAADTPQRSSNAGGAADKLYSVVLVEGKEGAALIFING